MGCLAGKTSPLRSSAAKTLGKFGEAAAASVQALSKCLTDKNISVRCAAALALGRIGKSAFLALPQLISCLKDSNVDMRRAVARTLVHLEKTCCMTWTPVSAIEPSQAQNEEDMSDSASSKSVHDDEELHEKVGNDSDSCSVHSSKSGSSSGSSSKKENHTCPRESQRSV